MCYQVAQVSKIIKTSAIAFVMITCPLLIFSQSTTVSGFIKDKKTGEPILFAAVQVTGTGIGAISNEYGFYSLTVEHNLVNSSFISIECNILGYPKLTFEIPKNPQFTQNFEMEEGAVELGTVEVTGNKSGKDRVSNGQMSTIRMPMKDINRIPCLGGETDIIKIVQLMPGVQRGGEGTTGMFVRGGTADQNLVLLDEATVYNIGHLFGFFSVFNSDALNDLTMVKGAFPAQYGGRLSSILDVRMKEGNLNKFHTTGGIGLLSSRITVEGPIKKDTASFMIAARRTYIDKLFKAVGSFLPYYFYDINLKTNRWLSPRDRIFFSSYLGNDILKFDDNDVEAKDDTSNQNPFGFGFKLGNFTNTLRWNHLFSDKLFSNISLIHTKFNYDINGRFDENNILVKSDVRDIGAKSDFDYFYSPDHHIKFGAQLIEHIFKPNVVSTAGDI